ncbi:MAG: NAD-dependent epimerase/dehydratase family protein [Deltaproteobacteria bacterium]|nr:NAD-dependent epimerase/dehydratase family protein [Deltaproteobacteria bacterium]
MKALVTGASGFAGAHLVHHLLESGDDVSALDRPDHPSERLASVRDRVTFFSSDICDADAVADALRAASPEAVYHLAGIAFVPTGADAPGRVMDVNLRGTVNVLEALRRHAPAARFVFASSGEVYGPLDDASLPATEVLPPRPKTIYALSKEFGERVIENYRREHGIDAVVLRLFNHIGPGQDEHFALPRSPRKSRRSKRGAPSLVCGSGTSMRVGILRTCATWRVPIASPEQRRAHPAR